MPLNKETKPNAHTHIYIYKNKKTTFLIDIHKTHSNNLRQPLKMTTKMVERAWANIQYFFHDFDPDTRRIAKRLKRLHLKILKKKQLTVFN